MVKWVTERAVYVRVKRALEREGVYLKINRSRFFIDLYGLYCSHDEQGNIERKHIDIEDYAKAIGILAAGERMRPEKRTAENRTGGKRVSGRRDPGPFMRSARRCIDGDRTSQEREDD